MDRPLTNIKEWLREVIQDAIRDGFRYHHRVENPDTELLSAKEAASFIGDAMPTFYKRVSDGEIQTCGGGKRIFVRKSDLIKWKSQVRTYSKSQLEETAIDNMINRRKK